MRGFHGIYAPWVPAEALVLLKDEFPNITLVMTGGNKFDGSLERTKQIITENSLHQEVSIKGFLEKPHLEAAVHTADLLINTPVIDNTPVSVMQAMASGLCIVSTNVEGLPDLIDDGIDGLLVPPDDPKAVATAVRRILTEPGLANACHSMPDEKRNNWIGLCFYHNGKLFLEIANTSKTDQEKKPPVHEI